MTIALLAYSPASRNHRVAGFEVAGDEQSRVHTTAQLNDAAEIDSLIQAAYRQIFHEQHMTVSNRQKALESQLRAGQINVRDFIEGLACSDSFRRLNYEANTNYRFAQMCVQRILGRDVYNEREKFAWSIVLATRGLNAFVSDLVNSPEYLENFGYHTVPFQRRRILPGRAKGEVSFEHMARTDEFHRFDGLSIGRKGLVPPGAAYLNYVRWSWQKTPPKLATQIGAGITWFGVGFIGLLFVLVLLGY